MTCTSPVEGRRDPIPGGLAVASLPQTPSTEEVQITPKHHKLPFKAILKMGEGGGYKHLRLFAAKIYQTCQGS